MKLKKIRIFLEDCYEALWVARISRTNIQQYKLSERKRNIKDCLTEKEKKEIDQYYLKHYGRKIPYIFHEVYKSFSGDFDVRYFPESLYEAKLLRLGNPSGFVETLEDKNFLPLLAEKVGVKMPRIIIYKIKDLYYNSKHCIITEEDAIEEVAEAGAMIVKPSVGTCGGSGIRFIENLNKEEVASLLEEYKTNFTIQESLESHSCLSEIHPESLNTIRIVSYLMSGKFYHVAPIFRMGVGKAKVDNACAGGIIAGIKESGYLTKYAMNQYCTIDKMTEHPDTKLKFETYQIPHIQKVIEAAKRLHSHIPQVSFVDWDFAIDVDGNPVLIEANVDKGGGMRLSQWTHGKAAFGENTDYILEWLARVEKISKSKREEEGIFL